MLVSKRNYLSQLEIMSILAFLYRGENVKTIEIEVSDRSLESVRSTDTSSLGFESINSIQS